MEIFHFRIALERQQTRDYQTAPPRERRDGRPLDSNEALLSKVGRMEGFGGSAEVPKQSDTLTLCH